MSDEPSTDSQAGNKSHASRFAKWLVAGEVRPVILVAIVFTAYMPMQASGISAWSASTRTLQVVASLLIFGIFLGVIVVTDFREAEAGSGTRKRVAAGAVAFGAIAAIFNAPFEGIALASGVGAVLGFFGMSWAQHV